MRIPRPSCSRCSVLPSRNRCPVNPESRESRLFPSGAGPSNGARRTCFSYNRGLCPSTACFRIHRFTPCCEGGHTAISCPRIKCSKSADTTKPAQASASSSNPVADLPPGVTPLIAPRCKALLQGHPDRFRADFVPDGHFHGYHNGFLGQSTPSPP